MNTPTHPDQRLLLIHILSPRPHSWARGSRHGYMFAEATSGHDKLLKVVNGLSFLHKSLAWGTSTPGHQSLRCPPQVGLAQ